MEPAELRDREVLREEMGEMDEWARWCVPKGAKEVGQVAVREGKRVEREGEKREREK